MLYKDLLRKYIEQSHLTLDQIEEKMRAKNFSTNKAYISKLQNGKLPPAGDDITRALAEITGGDPENLIIAGYKEKAPEEIKGLFKQFEITNEVINGAIDLLINSAIDDDGFVKEDIREILINLAEKQETSIQKGTFGKNPEEAKEFLKEKTGIEAKLQILTIAFEVGIQRGFFQANIQVVQFPRTVSMEPVEQVLNVPVLGKIPAGEPIFAEENIIEWAIIPNPGNYKEGDMFVLIVEGDSMIGSRIYPGDRVLVRVQPDVESGEIAVVNVNGYDATLKRVKKTESGEVILYPDNPKYEPIFLRDTRARICGKVIQVMFDPNKKL